LGTVQFGLNYGISNKNGQPTQKDVNNIIDYVYKEQINCFDTAQAYGNSEEVLGEAIKGKENLFIISKLKSDIFKKDALENVENSLNNLNISSLYALLLHDSNLLFNWLDEYELIVKKLKEEKKIKYFGVSIYNNDDFEMALRNRHIEFIQIPFNLFDQRAITQGWLERAKKHNKLIFIRSVFLQGLFFMDKDRLPSKLIEAKKELIKIEEYCTKLKMSRSELALSFVDSVATDALLLFGCDNLQQAHENIMSYNELKKLDKKTISDISENFRDVAEQIYNPTKW
jgi:aryl-alcohol dehydrogenase-like predicted oxidoreductase